MRSPIILLTHGASHITKMLRWVRRPLNMFSLCIVLTPFLICGCSHLHEGFEAKSSFTAANDYFTRGNYKASLDTYLQIIEKYPTAGDRVLFEMGIVYAYSGNEHKDYQKSLECFQKLIKSYPESEYRKDSELMAFNINNVIVKDITIAAQQAQIEALRKEAQNRGDGIIALQKQVDALVQEVTYKENENSKLKKDIFVMNQNETADMILIEKKERRLTLISHGKSLKTYKIALGGNPTGPKEMQGDNKTPEGTYVIDSRNRDSRYHLSLHISYPNEKDKKRAKQRGVSPGGDIMIHGIKNGFSWVGDLHSGVDWTKGCIAVTDEEIEEIYKLAPNGTIVEIRP
ncbi:MAG: L,D-transpeptidase family protein [Desulfuromonadales bacterium]